MPGRQSKKRPRRHGAKARSRALRRALRQHRTTLSLIGGALALLMSIGMFATFTGGCQRGGGRAAPAPEAERRARAAQPDRHWPRAVPLATPTKAVWVARFHFRTAEDVKTIIRNCAQIGANTVLWQVRGEGTVQYRSQLEPWSREFDYRDPGFDPLDVAVREAHARGLRIEAWMNVMPGWKGPSEPPIENQLWFQHPDWFLLDAQDRRQPLGDFYVILNPALNEVREHIAALAEEITRNYAVDGLHLDYIRYAWETTPNAAKLYPRDERTISLYERETGRTPDESPGAWDNWRAFQLTRLVSRLRAVVSQNRPGATLTAAVRPDPVDAQRGYLQSSVEWLRSGYIDAAYPMAYTEKGAVFSKNITAYRSAAPGARVIPGVGIYKLNSAEALRGQLQNCRAWGGDIALFSYESLHPTDKDRRAGGADRNEQSLRGLRRRVIAEFMR
ncbi:MAG: family 10 glycosylhydrolase [Phycisphaerales bacterium]|nr:family 10 glycosylhydrolase [Phycisphaerales bacterium]